MTLPGDRHSPNTQPDWEPAPLHVPAGDCRSGEVDGADDSDDDREIERPAGSHVYVIDLA